MKKIARTNIQLIAAIFIAFGLNSTARAMEEMEEQAVPVKIEESRIAVESSKREETITLESNEGQTISISLEAAQLSVTLKSMFADLKDTFKEEGKETATEVSTANTAVLNDIVAILEKVSRKLTPRKVDNEYSPYKVQATVDKVLSGKNFEHLKNCIITANYLDIPFLVNAVARVLVYTNERQMQQIVTQISLSNMLRGLLFYFKKHLQLKAAVITKEYSIADLIEEQPEEIKLTYGNTLNLSNLGLTSLDGIEKINSETSEIKDKVKILNLSRNQLTNIPLNVFQGLNNLIRLDLSDNKLTRIEYDAFQGLNNLKNLDLSNNPLTNIPTNAFQELNNLQELWLIRNQLTSIEPNAFQGLNNLQDLHLNGNKLTNIQPNTFKELNNLKNLDLSDNQLTNIQPNTFKELNNLKQLNLNDNQLTSIEANAFQGLNNLQSLELFSNLLTNVPTNAFQGLNNLQSLYLSDNKLTSIQPNAFQGLDNLRWLHLGDNHLTSIQPNTFQGLNNLQDLRLNGNKLDESQKQTLRTFFGGREAILLF